MATINRLELLEDVKMRMRSDNVFSDAQMNKIIDDVIGNVGDDSTKEKEVLCKSLRDIAENNKLLITNAGSIKSEKIENVVETTFYQNNNSGTWDDYLEALPSICTRFGYSGLNDTGYGFIHINVSTDESVDDAAPIDVNPTTSTATLTGL